MPPTQFGAARWLAVARLLPSVSCICRRVERLDFFLSEPTWPLRLHTRWWILAVTRSRVEPITFKLGDVIIPDPDVPATLREGFPERAACRVTHGNSST
jgi:hypothetical protein